MRTDLTPAYLGTRSAMNIWRYSSRDRYAYQIKQKRLREFGQEAAKNGWLKNGKIVEATAHTVRRFIFDPQMSGASSYLNNAIFPAAVINAIARDANKFSAQEWQAPVWHEHSFFVASGRRVLHQCHVSKEDPTMVAYAETLDKLVAERYTRVKPGRYLQKFFADELSEVQIRELAERQIAMSKPRVLHFIEGNDPDGWVRVYDDGPSSCMAGEDCVRVYAHEKSVLRLAHLIDGNDEIVARSIVREDTEPKQYIRVYPDQGKPEHTDLRSQLEARGYVRGSLIGVKLRAIDCDDGGYVMPYLDAGTGHSPCIDDDGECGGLLTVSRHGWDAQTTRGFIETAPPCTCPSCGDACNEDDLIYVEWAGESMCESCVDNGYTYVVVGRSGRHKTEDYVPDDEAIFCESDNTYYSAGGALTWDIYECQICEKYYSLDDLVFVTSCDGYVHVDETVLLDIEDDEGNSAALPDEVARLEDGRTVMKDIACQIGEEWHLQEDCIEIDGVWHLRDTQTMELFEEEVMA